MIRYKCVVSYCGKEYEGWQRQKKKKTIQGTIEDALFVITQVDTPIVGSGRTDAKVNAVGQVFHFDTNRQMPIRKWTYALNGRLPDDIHIESMEEVSSDFHARHDATEKQYDYVIHTGSYNVFEKDYVYQCPYALDVKRMKEAISVFEGTHDFSAFCTNSYREMKDQTRIIRKASLREEGDKIILTFVGNGFMRHMVRMMVGQLLEVGMQKATAKDIQERMEAKSKISYRKTAPAEGLCLVRVSYDEIPFYKENG